MKTLSLLLKFSFFFLILMKLIILFVSDEINFLNSQWKTITCSVMCCGCGSIPTSAANLEAGGCISEYQREKDLARSEAVIPTDTSIALTLHRPLYPPGRIIHVVRHHPNKGE